VVRTEPKRQRLVQAQGPQGPCYGDPARRRRPPDRSARRLAGGALRLRGLPPRHGGGAAVRGARGGGEIYPFAVPDAPGRKPAVERPRRRSAGFRIPGASTTWPAMFGDGRTIGERPCRRPACRSGRSAGRLGARPVGLSNEEENADLLPSVSGAPPAIRASRGRFISVRLARHGSDEPPRSWPLF